MQILKAETQGIQHVNSVLSQRIADITYVTVAGIYLSPYYIPDADKISAVYDTMDLGSGSSGGIFPF